MRPVLAGDRDHRECLQQSASSRRDNGNRAHASHDGTFCASRAEPLSSRLTLNCGPYTIPSKKITLRLTEGGDFQISAKLLRDQITSGARTVLARSNTASALLFVVAFQNVANPILARTCSPRRGIGSPHRARRKAEALRRMLLAESLCLRCQARRWGMLSAQTLMVEVLARYTSRFSVRAPDLTVDSQLAVGAIRN